MTDKRFKSIPPTDKYPGMVKRRIGKTDRCIHIYGWGEDVEQAAEAALSKALARNDGRLKETNDE